MKRITRYKIKRIDKKLKAGHKMEIKEILELTKEKRISEIAKEFLEIGEKPAREALRKAGCYTISGKKGWFFEGDEETLNKSIYDFHEGKVKPKLQETHVTNNVVPGIIRKRFSVDLDIELIKQMKIKSVLMDRNLYELVEEALKDFLKK